MNLSSYTIKEFIEELSSKSPAPGGGSASALSGAIGVALVSMVSNLTIGKEKFKDRVPLLEDILKEAQERKMSLVTLIDKDTEVYNMVTDVFKMPKENEEQKKKRDDAMEKALKNATIIPLTIMEEALKSIKLHEKALGNTTKSTISDVGVGVLSLKTALYGGWLNVKINLNSIKDESFIKDIEKKAKAILNEGIEIADRVYNAVESELI